MTSPSNPPPTDKSPQHQTPAGGTPSPQPPRGSWRSVAVLTAVALVVALALAGIQQLTAERIADQRQAAINTHLSQVIPGVPYDNALHRNRLSLNAAGFFQTDQPLWLHQAQHNGRVTAVIFDVVAPDGYNGDIRLLIGLTRDGVVTGVRVTQHLETPGLGDAIETEKSDWVQQFVGRHLGNTPAADWQVSRRGPGFDAISGATVTSSAMVKVVERTLRYFAQHQETLLTPSTPQNDTEPENGTS